MKITKYALNIFGFTLIICNLFISANGQSLKERYLNPPFPSSITDSGFTSWQWLSPIPQGNTLYDVQMIDSNITYAVGNNGTFLKTTNGGKTWSVSSAMVFSNPVPIYYPTMGILTGVFFTDANTGYAVGIGSPTYSNPYRGKVSKTTNGGITWTDQVNGTSDLKTVSFADANHGFAVGEAVIVRTIDGGKNWLLQEFYQRTFTSVFCLDSNRAFVVGNSYIAGVTAGVILRTTDGGLSWDEKMIQYSCNNVFFISADTGYVLDSGGSLLCTTDGGENWFTKFIGFSSGIRDIYFSDSNLGVAVGDGGTILRTSDGGDHWTLVTRYTGMNILGVSLHGPRAGTVVGEYGIIFRSNNSGLDWNSQTEGTVVPLMDVSFVGLDDGIAVGAYKTILRTTNGGITWRSLESGLQAPWSILGVARPSKDTAFIIGEFPFGMLKTVDGGSTWQTLYLDEYIPNLQDVFFLDTYVGWVVGKNIYRTSDGGATWIEQSTQSGAAIHFANKNVGTVVDYGLVLHTTDGGTTWTTQISPTTGALYGVFQKDSLNAFISGSGGIHRTTDGGQSWTTLGDSQGIPHDWLFTSVSFANRDVGVAVGLAGMIIQTTDGGFHWKTARSTSMNHLRSVSFARRGETSVAYAVGWGGTILCSAIPPFNPKTWTWTGLYDSSWNNPNNWSPVGTPLPGDSVIIAQATHSPIIDSVQQQIVIASLNILSGGRLTITDALPRFVVLADVTVYGTLEIRPPAATTIIVGGNWTIQPGGSDQRFTHLAKPNSLKLNDEGFIPYHSMVLFSGSGDMAGNFYNLMFDTTSSMRSIGNITLQNQCTMIGDVSLRRNDTVFVTASFPQALLGPGRFLRGTIKRNIEPSTLEPYNFESKSSFIKFDGSGTYPSSITITTFPDTTPSNFGDQWTVIPSRVDTATNTIVADSIKEFSKWVFGIPRPRVISDTSSIVQRVYEIKAEGGSEFSCELSLYYEQSEVPIGLPEDSLQLIRLEGSVDVKRNVVMLPKEFLLGQNYPNPFNPSTTIRYELPIASHVTLKVYNVLGQEVATLVNEKREAGRYEVVFDASELTSSVYFYRFIAGGFVETKKLLFLK